MERNRHHHYIAIVLALVLCLSLTCGCNTTNSESNYKSPSSNYGSYTGRDYESLIEAHREFLKEQERLRKSLMTFDPTLPQLSIVTTKPPQESATDGIGIYISKVSRSVENGCMATLSISGKPNTTYTATVYYSSGKSEAEGLGSKKSNGLGDVTWSWKVGTRTKPGIHSIVISGGGYTARTTFRTYE